MRDPALMRDPASTWSFTVVPVKVVLCRSRVIMDFCSSSGKSGIWLFLEIWPSPAPDKFLAIFADISAAAVRSVNYRWSKITNAADLLSGLFAVLICVTRMIKIQNSFFWWVHDLTSLLCVGCFRQIRQVVACLFLKVFCPIWLRKCSWYPTWKTFQVRWSHSRYYWKKIECSARGQPSFGFSTESDSELSFGLVSVLVGCTATSFSFGRMYGWIWHCMPETA